MPSRLARGATTLCRAAPSLVSIAAGASEKRLTASHQNADVVHILTHRSDASEQVTGVSGSVHKKFDTYDAASQYAKGGK